MKLHGACLALDGHDLAHRRVIVVLPHSLVGSACVAELLVAALLGDPAVVEHHDLVDLVKPVAFVGAVQVARRQTPPADGPGIPPGQT